MCLDPRNTINRDLLPRAFIKNNRISGSLTFTGPFIIFKILALVYLTPLQKAVGNIMKRKIDSLIPIVNAMDNESQVRILGVIDKLRELGINDNVSLPQVWLSLQY